jgi:hypothetical protein
MRINVCSEGFQLTPQLRGVVVSRLLSAPGPFNAHIELVVVELRGQYPPQAARHDDLRRRCEASSVR